MGIELLLRDVPMRPGVFSLSKWTPSWKEKGQALSASSGKRDARGRLVSEEPSQAACSAHSFEFACFSALWILSI